MPGHVVVGTQRGDEGRGKIVDYLGSRMDAAVRLQGGNNAGHTVVVQDKHIGQNQQVVLHLLTNGMLQKASCIIGPGVVVDPFVFLKEINQLEERGFNTDHILPNDCSHIITSCYVQLDVLIEVSLKDHKVGATKRRTGSYYADKYSYQGLCIGDLQDFESFKERLKLAVDMKSITFQKVYEDSGFSYEELVAQSAQIHKALLLRIINAQIVTNQALDAQKQVLFEGAQVAMLDINYGNYPYVTSPSPASVGVYTSAGVSPEKLDVIVGITKAYSMRVGEGPFASELFDDTGVRLREQGYEFEVTTGRPKHRGWLDVNAARHAAMTNGLSDLVITKLDILSGLEKVYMCAIYDINGVRYDYIPSSIGEPQRAKPTYEEFDGWQEDIFMMKTYEELPENRKIYLRRIEEPCNIRIPMISVGPERNCNIYLYEILKQLTTAYHFCNIILLSE